jgi:hypothetical protein
VPLEDALLLEQKLTENGHPGHTLITYPGLGHYFYPEDYWSVAMVSIQDYVLQDLEAWLKDPARKVRSLDAQLKTDENIIEGLQIQLGDLNSLLDHQTSELENQVAELSSESTDMQNTVIELEHHMKELQSALNSTKNLTYIALGVGLIAVLFGVIIMFQNRNRS